jgi:hypothetical protein
MDNNIDTKEELKTLNQEVLLNKKRTDLETAMESLIVFYKNYSNTLATEINHRVCLFRNIEPDSEQGKIFYNTITGFFTIICNKLKEDIDKKVDKIKEKIDNINDEEYNKELRYLSIKVVNQMLEFYGENIDMLINELTIDTDDLTKNRITNYLFEFIYVKMMNVLRDQFMYSIKVIGNNYEENKDVMESINEKTIK